MDQILSGGFIFNQSCVTTVQLKFFVSSFLWPKPSINVFLISYLMEVLAEDVHVCVLLTPYGFKWWWVLLLFISADCGVRLSGVFCARGYFSSCGSHVDVLPVASVLVTDDQPCTAEESPMCCMWWSRTQGCGCGWCSYTFCTFTLWICLDF